VEALAALLSDLAGTAFRWSAVAFVLLNGAAVAGFLATRDRRLVNRFTSPLLLANLLLLGTGLGVPAMAVTMRLVVQAVAATAGVDPGPPAMTVAEPQPTS
jgi:hypothetical protein